MPAPSYHPLLNTRRPSTGRRSSNPYLDFSLSPSKLKSPITQRRSNSVSYARSSLTDPSPYLLPSSFLANAGNDFLPKSYGDLDIPKHKCSECKIRWTSTRVCNSCLLGDNYGLPSSIKSHHVHSLLRSQPVPSSKDYVESKGMFKDSLPGTSVIVLSTNMTIARITNPALKKLAVDSKEWEGRSLLSLIHREDEANFFKFQSQVLRSPIIKPSIFPASNRRLATITTGQLLRPMKGATCFSDFFRFRHSQTYQHHTCELTLWLGAAFGAKIDDASTYNTAIVIGTLSYIQPASSSAMPIPIRGPRKNSLSKFATQSPLVSPTFSFGSHLSYDLPLGRSKDTYKPGRSSYTPLSPLHTSFLSLDPFAAPPSFTRSPPIPITKSPTSPVTSSISNGSYSSRSASKPQFKYGLPPTRTLDCSYLPGYEENFRLNSPYFNPLAKPYPPRY